MFEKETPQDFSLEDILKEFAEASPEAEEVLTDGDMADLAEEVGMTLDALTSQVDLPTVEVPTVPEAEESADEAEDADDTIRVDNLKDIVIPAPVEDNAQPVAEASGDTLRMDPVSPDVPKEQTPDEEIVAPPPILLHPRSRLRELKKKLVAGPEKRYYELSEIGLGRVQAAILVNLVIVGLCIAGTAMFDMGLIPESRLKLMVFSQVLAMMVSALLGCYLLLDTLGELFKGKFTLNTLMFVTLIVCIVDAVFCLQEQRVPCCAAFCLEMTMALWNRSLKRQTEMGQMDTLRKAVRLDSVVKEEEFFEGRPGILKGQGEVEDFMDNYQVPSDPEKKQNRFALLSLLICIGIAVLCGVRHGISLGIQIFATSLLVALPASFFVSLSRPMAILERRLHMVGTVLCGWQGVEGLQGIATIPLRDEDLFPIGASKLNGVKFYGDRTPDDIIAYAAALIEAHESGLSPVFSQLLKSRSGIEYPVENPVNYGDEGIGGEVQGEPVLLGTLDFMQNMGVEVPGGTMVNQAIYCAIDGQFCAVFAITYARMKAAAAGLVSLCAHRKVTPVLVGGNFMINESFLRSKFSVNTRRIAFPTWDVRKDLRHHRANPECKAYALITQDNLAAIAYAVSGARAVRSASRLGNTIHMVASILGMLIMAALAYLGSAELLTPLNVLLYQLVWLIPGLLATEWTRAI